MSAVAAPFDPALNMGPRPAFTWLGPLEPGSSNNSLLGHSLAPLSGGSEPGMTNLSETRPLISSPSREIMTLEQQEFKRQRDRARRDFKLSARTRCTPSNPYTSPPPMSGVDEVSSSTSLPPYSPAPPTVPLISSPATTLRRQPYLPSYSPAFHEQSRAVQMFSPPYQQPLQTGYSTPMEFSATYSGPGEYSIARNPSLPISQDARMAYQVPPPPSTNGASTAEGSQVRVVQSRPKPRCWEHGCNGRQFSTFSNLLRHQREKSGQAAKATCPNCGAEFTRTTARNGHLLHDKCKQRRNT